MPMIAWNSRASWAEPITGWTRAAYLARSSSAVWKFSGSPLGIGTNIRSRTPSVVSTSTEAENWRGYSASAAGSWTDLDLGQQRVGARVADMGGIVVPAEAALAQRHADAEMARELAVDDVLRRPLLRLRGADEAHRRLRQADPHRLDPLLDQVVAGAQLR
jgi:hypothetical protein